MKKISIFCVIFVTSFTNSFAQAIEIEMPVAEGIFIAETENESEIEMQVVASKVAKRITDTSADVTVIDAETLEESAGSSVTDVLRENGIVSIDGVGNRKTNDGVYIQGMSSDKLLIIVDGQRVRDGSMGGISALKRLSLSSIERIEIIKGPSSFLWGSDAMAGVIYIETKKGSGGDDGWHGEFGSSYRNNPYFDANNHFTQSNVNMSCDWATGESVWFGGSFEYGNSWLSPFSVITLPVPTGPETYKVQNVREQYTNFDTYAGGKFSLNDMHEFDITAKYQQENSPLNKDEILGQDNFFQKVVANVNYDLYAFDNVDLSLTTGATYDYESRLAHNENLEDYYLFNNNELLAIWYLNDIFTVKGGYGLDVEFFNELSNDSKLYNQLTHALFFGGDAAIDGDVEIDITAGARYQATTRNIENSDTDYGNIDVIHSISPEVGVVVKPLDWLGVKVHGGHSFKVPELLTAFRDYFDHSWFYAAPNPDLLPESAWGGSASFEVYPIDGLTFSIGGFGNYLENLIAFDDTGEQYNGLPTETPYNIGKAYTAGFNIGSNGVFNAEEVGVFDYSVNAEFLFAREIREFEDMYIMPETYERFTPHLTDRPAYTLSGSTGWKKDSWGTSLKVSGFYFAEGYTYEEDSAIPGVYEEQRTPAYSSIDVRLSQDLFNVIKSEKIDANVYAEVKNVANFVYDSDGDGDTDRPERQLVFGFKVEF